VDATLGQSLELFILAVVAATIGSLAGLGGGFLITPVLRIFYHLPPAHAAGLSLLMVTANVFSASIAFLRQGRVLLALAVPMGIAAIPGSIVGALLVHLAPGKVFDYSYAVLLLVIIADMLRRGKAIELGTHRKLPWGVERTFTDRVTGYTFRYSRSVPVAVAVGAATGFLSSFFGIGGGILVVPVLLKLFAIPAHVVSASSHMVILFSAPVGVAVHAVNGDVDWRFGLGLTAGGLVGGQIGAALSRRISGGSFVKILAAVLALAAGGLVVSDL
jgi:uncharacterized membrane protein YfcA